MFVVKKERKILNLTTIVNVHKPMTGV